MKLKFKTFFAYFCLFSASVIVLSSCMNTSGNANHEKDSIDNPPPVVIHREFGLPVDSFKIIKSTIHPSEFLSNILSPHGISARELALLAQKSRKVFDIRDLRAGLPYTLFCSKDSLQKARYFVYQPNPVDYVVYDLTDSMKVYKDQLPVTVEQRTSSGIIRHSLFQSLQRVQADPDLAIKLADIYAWDIDFYAIKKGDWFKVIYDQQYIKGQPVGLGRIKAAVFGHGGQKFYAFYFKDDSTNTDGYYDAQAKSLRKAFLKAPLKYYRISSRYSLHRYHPIQHRMKAHLGTDYAAPKGTPIMSTAAGTVIASRYTRFNGNYVKIRHNSVYTTQYLHMSRRAVKVGQHVKQGQVIGYVGMTGLATGPHVCYRFWKNGRQVNPLIQHFPPAEPIKDSDREAFTQLVTMEKAKLDEVAIDSQVIAQIRPAI